MDKRKQEVQRKDQEEQEVRKTEIREKIAEKVEKIVELVVDSTGKRKTNIKNQQDLEKRERNEGQYDMKPQCNKSSRIILVRY